MFNVNKCVDESVDDGTETVINYGTGEHMHCNDLDGIDCDTTPIAVDPRCPINKACGYHDDDGVYTINARWNKECTDALSKVVNSKKSVDDTFTIKSAVHWTGGEDSLYYGMGFKMTYNSQCFDVETDKTSGCAGCDDYYTYTFTVKKLCRSSIDFMGEDA